MAFELEDDRPLKQGLMMRYCMIGIGGIAKAIIKQLGSSDTALLISTKANPIERIRSVQLDVTQPGSVAKLANIFSNELPDIIINTVGMLHRDHHMPEKTIREVRDPWFMESIRTNTLPTLHIAQALDQILKRSDAIKFLTLSARVGSIEDNHLGGWTSYRASKCAMNMIVKNVAIEWQRKFPNAAIISYHPGTVATPLSSPFQANVSKDKLFSPETAACHLLEIVSQVTTKCSGQCLDWQGHVIPY